MPDRSKPRLLIVDDDWNIRDGLKSFFCEHDFEVQLAENAAGARRMLHDRPPDLVLLDVMMPGEDGISLCRSIAELKSVPVILLSARSEDIDRIVGLEVGADDYVGKPFHPRELLARVRAVLRRAENSPVVQARDGSNKSFAFDRWVFEVARRQLKREDGIVVPLSAGEAELLMVFLTHPNTVLSRDRILDLTRIAGEDVYDRSVDSQISRFRKKIEHDPKAPELIKTVWGGGYILSAQVKRL